jgi:acyl-CoA thioester hydrolase
MQDKSDPLPHLFPVRVYYEDTDFSGAVYHANYLRFMERGRTEYLRQAGIHQQAVHAGEHGQPFGFVVSRMTIEFLRPARMDDLLQIETVAKEIRGAAIDLVQRVLRGDDVLVRTEVRVACVINGRAARLPLWVRQKLGK